MNTMKMKYRRKLAVLRKNVNWAREEMVPSLRLRLGTPSCCGRKFRAQEAL
jgi:hypothetical protein